MSAIRLKPLRKRMGMSLQDLADKTQLTRSYLSKVERGLSCPSVAVAMKIANALHVEVQRLFSEESATEAIRIVRTRDRLPLGPRVDSESYYEAILNNAEDSHQHTFVMTPAAEFSAFGFKEHAGEEFLFVHKGRIEIDFASKIVRLSAGDAVHFDALVPHKIRSIGRPAQVLIIINAT